MGESDHRTGPVAERPPSAYRVRRGVKALVTSSDAVLLLREEHANGRAFWTLPGGGVHPGEPPTAALRRELREELRCASVVGQSIDQFAYAHTSRPRTVSFYTVHDCALTAHPVPNADEGVSQYRWVCPRSPPTGTLPQVRDILQRSTVTTE
jgi:ADP-ribose pyrophosphatase YjhB (NUDIX family)